MAFARATDHRAKHDKLPLMQGFVMTWVKILRWSVSEIAPMKKAIAPAALIIILMTQSSLQFHEVLKFFTHRDAIASVLCVERGRTRGVGGDRRVWSAA